MQTIRERFALGNRARKHFDRDVAAEPRVVGDRQGGGTKKTGASTDKMGAPTEMRIATPKRFAAPSEIDDAPAQRIVWTPKRPLASNDRVHGPATDAVASADDADATELGNGVTSQGVDATVGHAGATEKSEA